MTAPTDPSTETAPDVPLPLKVAAGLCAAVGILSLFGALAVSIPLVTSEPVTWIPLVVNITAAISMCLAAFFVWKQRKVGVALILVAWLLPSLINVLAGGSFRLPSLLMVLALLTLALSWHLLR
jgi:hypothetical protein